MIKTRPATLVASGFTFLEGPRWHASGLYVSDFYSETVLRIEEDGSHVPVCSVPGRPSGLGFLADGSMLIVSMLGRTIMRWDGTRLTTHAEFGHLIDGYANDMLVTPEGWAFVGNFGNTDADPGSLRTTGLVRVSPSGGADIVARPLVFPNGIVFSSNHDQIIVAETFAGRLTAFDYTVDARGGPVLGGRRVLKQFNVAPEYLDIERAARELDALPDGLAVDAEGAVWVASANSHAALRIAPDGEILEAVDVGELSAYAVALGGHDGQTLYLCCSPPLGVSDPSTTFESVLMAARVDAPAASFERKPCHSQFAL
ncbi:SMP-30/gluconolactonase/LRE family protein [Paenarthrobacter aromaticivorans]|uniref:SMP-30/gluconolactonase/LRE family protein n=1 Tax=Paenarthrobacter aromaticivorans TaxID=2849150 RepID=A0ABS6I2I5_9MICC|nr:SMP-30/gluconolactonase/LRE family protein [Paenarthrobacter sp. MMS21-TAE1-1]MBU8864799.1 SMP-30/gluconolactonase/LRE family protein [Paenarthrobacter sp. MMS21-TAE1-1]